MHTIYKIGYIASIEAERFLVFMMTSTSPTTSMSEPPPRGIYRTK